MTTSPASRAVICALLLVGSLCAFLATDLVLPAIPDLPGILKKKSKRKKLKKVEKKKKRKKENKLKV